MKSEKSKTRGFKIKVAAIIAFMIVGTAWGTPVWHCSRTSVQIADISNNFVLANLTDREVIQVSLHDLHSVYQGDHVKLSGGKTLSAYVVRDDELTKKAMASLGIPETSVINLSHRYAISGHNIFLVKDTAGMMQCIAQHHPAIGYFSKTTETESLGPCF